MAKKKYVKPMMVSEEFVPNEYVAACEYSTIDMKFDCADATYSLTIRTNDLNGLNLSTGSNGAITINGEVMHGQNGTVWKDGNGNFLFQGAINNDNPAHSGSLNNGEHGANSVPCNLHPTFPHAHHHVSSATVHNHS